MGSIESGVDFERRVLDIYQDCRTEKEIKKAFASLQKELETSITSRMTDTRKMLLEHFDEDVHERLKVNLAGTRERLDRIGRNFWNLTKQVLGNHAEFDDQNFRFRLNRPFKDHPCKGTYQLVSKNRESKDGNHIYRLSHPLGELVIKEAQETLSPPGEVCFDISANPTKIAAVEKLKGKSGWLVLHHLKIDSFETEEYLLFSGVDDHGKNLNQETCEKLFNCIGKEKSIETIPQNIENRLKDDADRHLQAVIARNIEENNRHLSEACIQLDKWAEDMEKAASKEMADTKRKIADIRRQVRLAENMQKQAELQDELKKLEKQRRRQQQKIFEVEDEIAEKRDSLVDQLAKKMEQKTTSDKLFTIRWSVI